MNNLAGLYYTQDKYAMAEFLYRQSATILGKVLGEDHPDIATCLINLAEVHEAQGNYAAAEPLLRQALKIHQATLGENGENYPDFAT